MELLANLISISNLILSVALVVLYGFGFFRVGKSQVDGKLKLTKFTLLTLFVSILVKAVLQVVIYYIAVYDTAHISEALYLENLKNLFINTALVANAVLLALIVERN